LAWIEQLAPGGAMLVNVRGDVSGALCLLTKTDDDDEVIGPVVRTGGDFMWLRRELDNPLRAEGSPVRISAKNVARSLTPLSPSRVLADSAFAFFLQLQLPGLRMMCSTTVFDPELRRNRPRVLLYGRDGSHAEITNEPGDDGQYRVVHGGARRLWDTVETAFQQWTRLGYPEPSRFGVVANPTVQFAWLDSDTSWFRWPLPLG